MSNKNPDANQIEINTMLKIKLEACRENFIFQTREVASISLDALFLKVATFTLLEKETIPFNSIQFNFSNAHEAENETSDRESNFQPSSRSRWGVEVGCRAPRGSRTLNSRPCLLLWLKERKERKE